MLHRRQDDIRLLKLEVAEAARAVLVTSKLRHIIPGLDLDMASMQRQLLETRRTADELALQLESPDNKARWGVLRGPDGPLLVVMRSAHVCMQCFPVVV